MTRAIVTAFVTAFLDGGAGAADLVARAAADLGLAGASRRLLADDVLELEGELALDADATAPDRRARAQELRRGLGDRLGDALDVAVQLDRPAPRAPRLVIMDMDSTVITIEVIDELARRHGVGAEVAAITARAMAGELDFEASLRARVGRLAGLPVAVLDELAAALPLTDGAARLIATVRALGGWTAIVSGGFTFAARPLAARLGVDHVHANQLATDGRALTGALVGDVVGPARKAALVGELAALHGVDLARTVAIGDGANDLLMLARAGLGVAFHGKPRVRAAADTAITRGGLDRVLYLLGLSAAEQAALAPP